MGSTLPLLFTLLLLSMLLLSSTLLYTLLLLSILLLFSALLLLFTLLQLFTLLPLSTPVLLARALINLSTSLSRERRGPLARPRRSGPRSLLYPRLIPSVTQLRLVWPLILVRELLVKSTHRKLPIESQDENVLQTQHSTQKAGSII